ncbi:putative glycosyltransferase EpsE [compost metagenome]
MKFLFFSPYAGHWYLHTFWEAAIAIGLRHRGSDVRFMGCDQVFRTCDMFWGQGGKNEASCANCHSVAQQVFTSFGFEPDWISNWLGASDYADVQAWLDHMTPSSLLEAQFDELPLAEWCRPSWVAHFHQSELADLVYAHTEVFRGYLSGAALTTRALSRYLDAETPDVLVTLNGTFFSHKVASELARHRGIRVIYHERGQMDETLRLAEDLPPFDFSNLDRMRENWKDVPLSAQELRATARYIHQRRHGINTAWFSFSPPPGQADEIKRRLGIPPDRRVISLFTTSQSEAATDHWVGPYEDQFDWIEDTLQWLRANPDYHLVIRIHPNEDHAQGKSEDVLARYRRLAASAPANVSIVWPKDDISSYTLMDLSCAVLVYSSTVGAEAAAAWGLPVIAAALPPYRGWGCTVDVESREAYPVMLDRAVITPPSDEIRRQAFRFFYRFVIWASIPFPLVSVINYSQGKLCFSHTDDLAPGQEPYLDRLVEAFLGHFPLYPEPVAMERERSTGAENSFFRACEAGPQGVARVLDPTERPLVSFIGADPASVDWGDWLNELEKQGVSDFEIHVVGKGLAEERAAIAPFLTDSRIRYEVMTSEAVPVAERLNRCLEATSGALISFLGASPETLQAAIRLLDAQSDSDAVITLQGDTPDSPAVLTSFRRLLLREAGVFEGDRYVDTFAAACEKVGARFAQLSESASGRYEGECPSLSAADVASLLRVETSQREENPEVPFVSILDSGSNTQTLRDALTAYIQAFRAQPHGVTLLFLAEQSEPIERLTSLYEEVCQSEAISSDEAPEVLVRMLRQGETLSILRAYLPHAQAFVALGGGMHEAAAVKFARKLGRKVLFQPVSSEFSTSYNLMLGVPPMSQAEHQAASQDKVIAATAATRPLVSVVAYIYNYAHYLDGAIQSILDQTFADFELFILDDGSTDGTPELVKKYLKDPRVRYEYQQNKGRDRLHETFNRCLEATTGELIAIANGDDLMHPEKLERQVKAFLANPEVEIVYHGATFIDKDGAYFGEASFGTPFNETILGGRLLGRYLFEACHIPNPSVMFRRSILPRIGLQEYGWMHDYQFWLKAAAARCRFAYLPDKLLQYRIHEESHSTSSKRTSRIVEENQRMRREMRPRYTIEDLYPEIEYCRDQEAARVSAHIDMGNRFAHWGMPDMALEEYFAALAMHPNHPVAINNAAIGLLLTGEKEEGLRHLRGLATDVSLEVVQRNLAEAERAPRLEEAKFHLLSEDSAQTELFQIVMPQGGAPRPEIFEASVLAVVDASSSVETIQQLLMSYMDAFSAESPQALVLLISAPEQAEVIGQAYGAACEALHLDPERTPLVSVQQAHPEQLTSVFLGQLLSARAVVSLSDSAHSATLMNLAQERGRLVLQHPTPEALIQAVGTVPELPESSADFKREPQVVPFKFVLPYLESTAPARIEQALKAYLEAFAPDAARQLIVWLAPGNAPDEIAAMVDRACARLGKRPGEPFADVEVCTLPEPNGWDAEIVAFDALLDPGSLPPELVAAARQSDLLLLTTFTAQAFEQVSAGWEPAAIDIVLLTHERLAYLKQTVDALFARTRHPFRLTIVDNASGPELQAYLDELRPRLHRLIRNSENRWTEAFTQGIAITRSDPFIVSDPDILVPQNEPCWLTRMLDLMAEHPEMGMVALNLDASNKPAKLPDVYVSEKSPHGPDLTLSYVGTVMQTIRRQYFAGSYTTDWHAVEAIRANGGLVGFANHLVGYHLGWNEDQDYPEHLVKKHQYFNGAYGSNLYKLYTQEDELLRAMDGHEPAPSSGLTSIVMLTWNQLAYTRLCIESVYNHTPEPFELILVDNGSTDGTVAYLENLAAEHANVKLVLNGTNRGYAGGNNQGLALASGDTLVLLNNDTVVSRGWLSGLHKALQLEGVGVAGPCSNAVVGPQLVTSVPYDCSSLEGLEAFARSWGAEHRDRYPEVKRIIGFCMAIRRDVLEQIGGLDTSFGMGNLEDDDYSIRVHLAGYKLVIAQEVFVHHFGSVTFKGQSIDYLRLMEANWKIFKEKYGLPADLSLDQGYRHSDITARAFEPAELMVPIFSPEAPVADLPERKQFNIVLCDRDVERLKRAVSAYLEAFEPNSDVALHVLAGTGVDHVHAAVLEVIEARGLQPDTIPDLALLDGPANPLELSGYLRAGDLVIASPEIAQGARDLGIPAFVDPGADLLRVAHQEFGGFDWEVAALNLGERKPERWLLTAERWQEPLEGFLRSAEGTSSSALYLRRPNEEAASLFEEISEWLLLKGFNPDQIPDIVVIDGPLPSEVAVFRLATAWIETGDVRAKAMALALGLRVISLESLVLAGS